MSKPEKSDRHKRKPFGLRIPDWMRGVLEEMAAERATSVTTEIIRGVREMMEREGRLPAGQRTRRPKDRNGES